MDNSPANAPLVARFQLNAEDTKAFEALAKSGTNANASQRLIRSLMVLFALILVASLVFRNSLGPVVRTSAPAANSGSTLMSVLAFLAPIALFLVFFVLILRSNKQVNASSPVFTEESTVRLDETGMMQRFGAFTNGVEWRGFVRVATSDSHLGLFTSATDGYIVPRRAFASDDDWQRYVDFARERWQQTQPAIAPIAQP